MLSSRLNTGKDVEYVACNLCSADDADHLRSDGPLHLVRCRHCGLVYVTPRLTEHAIQRLYDEGYFFTGDGPRRGYRDYIADGEYYLDTFRRRIRWLERHTVAGGRLLDVGCAAGFFLQVSAESGWEGYGVEPATCMAEHARSELGLRVFHGTLRQRYFPAGYFDLVTLWDVLEHLTDPRGELSEVNRVLRLEGLLVLETQNIASWLPKVMGERWHHYGNDLHLFHFTPETISRLLSVTGFVVETITKANAGKVCSLRFVVDKFKHLSQTTSRLAKVFMKSWPSLAGRSLYINLGDEMIVCARKSTEIA